MKATCVFTVASVVAASTVALTSADRDLSSCANKGKPAISEEGAGKEKYAPRFDGLRFIETLVTAHR